MSENPTPKTMRALIQLHDGYAGRGEAALRPFRDLIELAEVDVPEPRPGQVLIRVALASVNPSDVMFVNGMYGQPRKLGRPAGFEGTGEVVACGDPEAAGHLVGKRVAFTAQSSGTWAEYVIADAMGVIPLLDAVRDEDGAGMIVNPITAAAMFDLVKREDAKSFVMSAAASQLCKFLTSLARDEGYRPIALVRRDDQIDILKQQGAAHVLNVTADDFDARLAEVLKEERPEVFLDAVTGPLASQVFGAMGNGARWVVYGRLDPTTTTIAEPGQLIFQSKSIEGFWLTKWFRETAPQTIMAVVQSVQKRFIAGDWSTDVTERLSLDEVVGKLEAALAVPNGKVFIAPGQQE
ncbi:zinc-binding dehydrogenase [Oricola sp.]|uniref:zinc-binding dehydrogenase n=1 Tax=Oricola sp. TaxID=1979950 RepID=UPI003BAB8988